MSNPLDDLAHALAADGLGPHETSVSALVAFVDIIQVAPVAAAVLADTDQPEVARLRAFGLVARRLTAPPVPTRSALRIDAEMSACAVQNRWGGQGTRANTALR